MAAMTHQHKPKLEKAGHRRIMTVLLMFVFIDGMMFIAAGTLRWPLGWAYVSVTPLALGSWWALLPGGIAHQEPSAPCWRTRRCR